MLFQSKPTAIFYLRRQDAVLITKSGSTRLEIPSAFVRNLEVADAAKLAELIAGFLESHQCRNQQVLLVLDAGVVFTKDIPTSTDQAAIKDFESKLPFEPDVRQLLTTVQKGRTTVMGVNKTLYQAAVKGIQKTNKVKAVVPATVYGVDESKKIDRQTISTLFNDPGPPRKTNFLTKV